MAESAYTRGAAPISDNALAALRLGVSKAVGIARVEKTTMQSLLARLDRAEAAAAPDLVEALRNASGFLDTPVSRRRNSGDAFYDEVVASIRAALSRALGQEG